MRRQFGKRDKTEKKNVISNRKRPLIIVSASAAAVFLILLVVYVAGLGRYQSCFLNGTLIDEVDVSGMTIPELEERIGQYSLRVIERQADGTVLEEEILGSDIGIAYISTEPLEAVLQEQSPYLWFMKRESVYETDAALFYEEAILEEKIDRKSVV